MTKQNQKLLPLMLLVTCLSYDIKGHADSYLIMHVHRIISNEGKRFKINITSINNLVSFRQILLIQLVCEQLGKCIKTLILKALLKNHHLI